MKSLGKLKPYLIPILLGVIGALIYDRWVKSRLPGFLRGGVGLLLGLALLGTPELQANDISHNAAITLNDSGAAHHFDVVAEVAPRPHLAAVEVKNLATVAVLGVGFVILMVARSRGRKALGFSAMLAALTFSCVPARAEVITKGGAIQLRATPRETANLAFTNGVANPGVPLLFRITTFQGTNHFGFDTNGRPVVVNLGTNYQGYTGPINPATATGNAMLYFKNGLLVTSNQAASSQ
jgi:hypothetical protein